VPGFVVSLENVWKRLGGKWVLRGVNLTVDRGEGVLILGANGSGKTTLLRITAGLVKPSRGSVRVFDEAPHSRRVRERMGLVPHHNLLYPELTVRENLEYYAKLYGLQNYRPEDDEVVVELGLVRYLDRRVGELSFGWRRRADIARALMHRPRLLLIDEPFTGLDDDAQRSLAGLLARLREEGVSIVATSPSAGVVGLLSGFRVLRLTEGRLVEAGFRD